MSKAFKEAFDAVLPKTEATIKSFLSGRGDILDKEQVKELATDVNNVATTSFQSGYKEGYKDGLTAYAWWKDGIEYVGTCGTTLKEALKHLNRLRAMRCEQ